MRMIKLSVIIAKYVQSSHYQKGFAPQESPCIYTMLQRHQCNTSQSQSEMPDKHNECEENSGQSQGGPSERENTCHKLTLEKKLFTSLSREEQQIMCHIVHVSESTHEKTKWRHDKKFRSWKRRETEQTKLTLPEPS